MADETKTVVTERAGMVTERQTNAVVVVLMGPVRIVLVRACRVYIQSLVGFLTATGTGLAGAVADAVGTPIPVMDFGHMLLFSMSLAVAPATISLLQNIAELLAKWDATHPTLRA